MKLIRDIRDGLTEITGCLVEDPPEAAHRGDFPSVFLNRPPPSYAGEAIILGSADESFAEEPEGKGVSEFLGFEREVPEFDPVFEIGADVDQTFPALGGEEGERIRRSVLLRGMDALGWYVSFHRSGTQWGVYISLSGMAYLVKEALMPLSVPLATKVQLAFHAILNHELFHFATDYAVAQMELLHFEPWHSPAESAFQNGSPNYCVVEEQLANAYMLQAFRTMKPALRVRGKMEALRAFTKLQPEGYRDGSKVRPTDWTELLSQLARAYGCRSQLGDANDLLWRTGSGYDWPLQFPIRPRIDWRYCPIHLVDDGIRLGIPPGWFKCFSQLSDIEESGRFRNDLVTMPQSIQRAWQRSKERLQVAITPGADFKKWPQEGPNIYSVRINDKFRAHFQHRQPPGDWLALGIGNHKAMGHG